jgi:hypothetical protein
MPDWLRIRVRREILSFSYPNVPSAVPFHVFVTVAIRSRDGS